MPARRAPRQAQAPEYLRQRFELAQTPLVIGARRYELLRPRSADELISEEDFMIDERIPYWADCWPSCRVLATDYYADALEFTAANAERHALANVDTRLVDWRRLPDDLGTFDVVVASDVLYERPQGALVAAAVARTLLPGGLGLVSDPGRRNAEAFVDECGGRGLSARCVRRVPTTNADAQLTVSIYEIRHARARLTGGRLSAWSVEPG